jgi:hypothetical protein
MADTVTGPTILQQNDKRIPANTSSNSNQNDVNFVVPGAADSGNTYTVVAEFIKNY